MSTCNRLDLESLRILTYPCPRTSRALLAHPLQLATPSAGYELQQTETSFDLRFNEVVDLKIWQGASGLIGTAEGLEWLAGVSHVSPNFLLIRSAPLTR